MFTLRISLPPYSGLTGLSVVVDDHSMISEINSAMTALGGGYQLSVVDLSAYTNYGPP